MSDTIITITGPSAAGKSTLEGYLTRSDKFSRVVSTTTRPKRPGESSDAYHFVSRDHFDTVSMVESVEFNGHLYGVSASEIQRVVDDGRIPVVVVEPNGQAQIERWADKNGYYVMSIFIDCPLEVRLKRLVGRFVSGGLLGGDFAEPQLEAFASRLKVAVTDELEWADETWKYAIIINHFGPENESAVVAQILQTLSMFEDLIRREEDPRGMDIVEIK